MAKIIVGLSGEMASGKGTVAQYITEKYNASSYRFSTILRDVLNRLHIKQTRGNISKISTILRENFGEDLFAKTMAEDVKKDKNDFIVIDGIRRPEDIVHLREIPEFKFIYVEADMKKRYERIIQRDDNVDDKNKTFEEFEREHQLETELQIKGLKQCADFILDNNGTMEDLHREINNIINKN